MSCCALGAVQCPAKPHAPQVPDRQRCLQPQLGAGLHGICQRTPKPSTTCRGDSRRLYRVEPCCAVPRACRYETNLLNTAGQAMDFLADVNHSNVYVHLDTYHMHIEESGFEAAVRLCGDKLGYVHLGESHRCVSRQ